MDVRLTAEDEALVQKRLAGGSYASAEEVVHEALRIMDEEGQSLDERREQLIARIHQGIGEIERGGGMTPEEALTFVKKHKQEWRAERNRVPLA